MRSISLCLVLVVSVGVTWLVAGIATASIGEVWKDEKSENLWFLRFAYTLLGYSTIFVPGYIVVKYVTSRNLHREGGLRAKVLRLFLQGNTLEGEEVSNCENDTLNSAESKATRSLYQKAILLATCCAGLQLSYLSWGVLQEKIMTQEYTDETGHVEKFTDSQFLVFVNRILAFFFSGIYLLVTTQSVHRTPLYKYSFCSVSNTLSSWCQYEALKFISFPTQVLAKSGKVIPVMLMGKLISQTRYKKYEYVTALLMSVGMAAFLLGSPAGDKGSTVTTLSGVVLLCGYLVFDSFTANWQSALFKEHKPSSVQMMCGVNFMSCLLTSVSLVQQGGFFYSLSFASRYPRFVIDCLLTAVTSASGQLFIFVTIAYFGAVVFTIIMTVRQALSILLSCLLYRHSLSIASVFGIATVFAAIFLRMYLSQKHKSSRPAPDSNASKV